MTDAPSVIGLAPYPSAPGLEVGPAALELAENPPEEAAVHPAGDALAGAGVERVGLGVLDVVGQLVEERVEQFLQRPAPPLAVVGVNPDQPARLVIAAEDARRGAGVDVQLVLDQAAVNP